MFSLFLVQVIQAEIKAATLLAENKIPFPTIFPDSNIAKEYRTAETKTACILNKSLVIY